MDAEQLRLELIELLRDASGLDWCPLCDETIPPDVDMDPRRERFARLLEDRLVELRVLVLIP